MTDQHPHVVVLGGGYAGTMAANRLQQNTNIDITLVNPREEFVHRLRLHQFAAGTGIATAEYAPMLGKRVRLVVDSAVRIDALARLIRLESGIFSTTTTSSTRSAALTRRPPAYPVSRNSLILFRNSNRHNACA